MRDSGRGRSHKGLGGMESKKRAPAEADALLTRVSFSIDLLHDTGAGRRSSRTSPDLSHSTTAEAGGTGRDASLHRSTSDVCFFGCAADEIAGGVVAGAHQCGGPTRARRYGGC